MHNPYQPPTAAEPTDPKPPLHHHQNQVDRPIDDPASRSQVAIKLSILALILVAICIGLAPFFLMLVVFIRA